MYYEEQNLRENSRTPTRIATNNQQSRIMSPSVVSGQYQDRLSAVDQQRQENLPLRNENENNNMTTSYRIISHSPDCYVAHLNSSSPSYSNQQLQQYQQQRVESPYREGTTSAERGSSRDGVLRWSSADRNLTTPSADSLQIQPAYGVRFGSVENEVGQRVQQVKLSSENDAHKLQLDGDSLTLVILDCSQTPIQQINSPSYGASTSLSSDKQACDRYNNCYCQTELIVRQHLIPQDHSIQRPNDPNIYTPEQQSQNSNLRRETRSLESESRQNLFSPNKEPSPNSASHQKQKQQVHFDYDQPLSTRRVESIFEQESITEQNTHREIQYPNLREENYWERQTFRDRQPEQEQNNSQMHSNIELQTQPIPGTSRQQAENQPEGTGRKNTRLVKRWNWNKQEFEVTEVPDVPSPKPSPQPGRSSTDVWHQEAPEASSSSLSKDQSFNELMSDAGNPSQTTYEPSYLAYRVPDNEAVRSDPVYSDLMLELQRLEEGAPLKEPVIIEQDTSQRPVFGQPITPDYLEVDEYENAEFVCRLIPISDPDMSLEWTVNGKPLLESNRLTCEHEFGVARLRIKRCEAEDSGIYQCRAKNPLGEAISTASLRVHSKGNVQCESLNPAGLEKIRQLEEPKAVDEVEEKVPVQVPKFVSHIQDYVEKEEGESVHFECCLIPVDDPDLKTEWFFNGRPLVTGSRFHTIDDFGFIVLDIDWLFPRDTGEYVCRAKNSHGQDITRTVLRVRPAKNIILESQLDNPQIIDKLRQLEFPDVPPEPLPVDEPDKPPRFIEVLTSQGNKRKFVEGDYVHLEARVSPATDANLTVEWFHNGKALISGHRFKPSFDFGHIQLDILYVYGEDSGVYKCIAKNSSGESSSEIELQVTAKPSLVYQSQLPKEMEGGVQKIEEMEAMWNRAPDPEEEAPPEEHEPPRFVLKLKPFVAFEGSCARFCCRLVGRPRPRVTWTLNGQIVVSGSRHKLTHDGMYHLTITKCLLSDAGKLEVYARNSLGECYCATELQVKRKLDDYRGVLKNSPKPWYDEQSLKVYQRSRDQSDDDPSDSSPGDWASAYSSVNKFPLLGQQRSNLGSEHLVGYMEPDTPDVNLLADQRLPLLAPGDLHPAVLEQQVTMAPAPSTVKRALETKESVKLPEKSFQLPESVQLRRRRNYEQQQQGSLGEGEKKALNQEEEDRMRVFGNEQITQAQHHQQQQDSQKNDRSRWRQQQTRQDQHAEYLNRLRAHESVSDQADQSINLQEQTSEQEKTERSNYGRFRRQEEQMSQTSQAQIFDPRLPPPSPESVVHGKEVHSHTHKQIQKERRANREILREIVEREFFEQEHKGSTRDNVVRGDSLERRSATPDRLANQRRLIEDQQELQQQQELEQQMVLVEDYVVPPEFTQKIQPSQAIDGDEVRFQCAFLGDPQPDITWYRESKMIKPSNLYIIDTDLEKNTSTLVIKRVALNSNAVFTVKAENVAGSAKSSANLVVEPHPLPERSRAGLARQVGTALIGIGSSDEARLSPARSLSAMSGSSRSASVGEYQESGRGSSAGTDAFKVVRSIRTRKLTGEEMATLIRASPEGQIAPTFLHTIHDIQSKLGDLARLDARLIGTQPMEVRWLKDGERIRADRSHKMVLEGDLYTLLILECSQSDEGLYECFASNSVGEASCEAHLTILDSNNQASISGSRTPDFMTRYSTTSSATHSHSASRQSAATSASASASAAASSSLTSISASSSSSGFRQSNETQLSEDKQQKHYGLTRHQYNPLIGQYTPSSQSLTTAQQQHQYETPKLIKRLENQQVREGKSVTLRCQISSYPVAEVHWYKQGDKLIKPSKYFRIFKDNDETYCLKILETFPEDQGEYKCVARAATGPMQVETKAYITVIPNSPRE